MEGTDAMADTELRWGGTELSFDNVSLRVGSWNTVK